MKPKWMSRLFPAMKKVVAKNQKQVLNEGDYHSGSEGYTPNTPYPETQYGSGFDRDADSNDLES